MIESLIEAQEKNQISKYCIRQKQKNNLRLSIGYKIYTANSYYNFYNID